MGIVPDRIEKKILLRAPVPKVFRAIADAARFGTWFGVEFERPFASGQRILGRITPTKVDAEVAKLQEPHTGKAFEFTIDRIEPDRLFSFLWHPFAIDPTVDYSREEPTRVVFELQAVDEGTLLSITESGFDHVPLERRAQAYAANDGGWQHQTKLLEKYLASPLAEG